MMKKKLTRISLDELNSSVESVSSNELNNLRGGYTATYTDVRYTQPCDSNGGNCADATAGDSKTDSDC